MELLPSPSGSTQSTGSGPGGGVVPRPNTVHTNLRKTPGVTVCSVAAPDSNHRQAACGHSPGWNSESKVCSMNLCGRCDRLELDRALVLHGDMEDRERAAATDPQGTPSCTTSNQTRQRATFFLSEWSLSMCRQTVIWPMAPREKETNCKTATKDTMHTMLKSSSNAKAWRGHNLRAVAV